MTLAMSAIADAVLNPPVMIMASARGVAAPPVATNATEATTMRMLKIQGMENLINCAAIQK